IILDEATERGCPTADWPNRAKNPKTKPTTASIAYAIENPVVSADPERRKRKDTRVSELRQDARAQGLLMRNPDLDDDDPMAGSFGLWVLPGNESGGRVTMLRGWPRARWWTRVFKYWDDFTADGRLGP